MRIKKITAAVLAALAAFGATACEPAEQEVKTVENIIEYETISWVIPGERTDEFDKVEAEINKITRDRLGINVFFEFMPYERYAGRMDSRMAAGDTFDLCFTGYIDTYEHRARNGQFMPLTELLELAPRLKAELPEYAWETAKIEGEIYAIPNLQITAISTAVVLNKELVDKYGFDISTVKATKDVEPFLKMLKENEPEVTPVRLNWGIEGIKTTETSTFTEAELSGVYVLNTDGKIEVKPIYEYDFMMEAARTLYRWGKEGYIRNDVAVTMDEKKELSEGRFGIWFETYKPGVEQQRKVLTGNEVYAVRVSVPYLLQKGGQSAMTAINKQAPHPEEAMKLLELVNTEPEILNLLTYGIEGEHYEKVEDNVVRRFGNYSSSTWLYGNQFIIYTEEGQDKDVWEQTKKLNESAVRSPLHGFKIDTTNITQEISQCDSVLVEFSCMELGIDPTEEYWNQMEIALKAAGIEKIQSDIQRQVDEFLANKR